eukprot:366436-Chlamydomonas_euryale.AAC.33
MPGAARPARAACCASARTCSREPVSRGRATAIRAGVPRLAATAADWVAVFHRCGRARHCCDAVMAHADGGASTSSIGGGRSVRGHVPRARLSLMLPRRLLCSTRLLHSQRQRPSRHEVPQSEQLRTSATRRNEQPSVETTHTATPHSDSRGWEAQRLLRRCFSRHLTSRLLAASVGAAVPSRPGLPKGGHPGSGLPHVRSTHSTQPCLIWGFGSARRLDLASTHAALMRCAARHACDTLQHCACRHSAERHVVHPMHGDTVVHPMHGNTVVHPMHGDTVMHPMHGDTVVHPMHGDTVVHPMHGDTVVHRRTPAMLHGLRATPCTPHASVRFSELATLGGCRGSRGLWMCPRPLSGGQWRGLLLFNAAAAARSTLAVPPGIRCGSICPRSTWSLRLCTVSVPEGTWLGGRVRST